MNFLMTFLEKTRRSLGEIGYYFLRLPFYSLFSVDQAYRKARDAGRKRIDRDRQGEVAANLRAVLAGRRSEEEIVRLSRQHYEVLSCDDLDPWLWLLKPWPKIRKHIRVEGEEHFREVALRNEGCILLSAHFGGAFLIFDVVKELGGKPQGFGVPIEREHFKHHLLRWMVLRFRLFCVERAIGEKIILAGKRETGREFLGKLGAGYHTVLFFDVPPQVIRGKTEKVNLLGMDWNFPRGFLKVVAGRKIPVVPFFVHLTEDNQRTVRFYPARTLSGREEIGPAFEGWGKIFESYLLERPEQWFFWDGGQVFWRSSGVNPEKD